MPHRIPKASARKKVVVVGAGPAGLEAAPGGGGTRARSRNVRGGEQPPGADPPYGASERRREMIGVIDWRMEPASFHPPTSPRFRQTAIRFVGHDAAPGADCSPPRGFWSYKKPPRGRELPSRLQEGWFRGRRPPHQRYRQDHVLDCGLRLVQATYQKIDRASAEFG